jgi:hypothetical protein
MSSCWFQVFVKAWLNSRRFRFPKYQFNRSRSCNRARHSRDFTAGGLNSELPFSEPVKEIQIQVTACHSASSSPSIYRTTTCPVILG